MYVCICALLTFSSKAFVVGSKDLCCEFLVSFSVVVNVSQTSYRISDTDDFTLLA